MVRRYAPERTVDRDLLNRFLELATRAPSAGFSQGWDFVILADESARERFWSNTTDRDSPPDSWLEGMRTAPVLVVCLSDPERYLDRYAEPDKGRGDRDPARWPVPYWDVDVGMAAMIMQLAAVDAGLACCFFGVPTDRIPALRAALGIPADRHVVGVVALGHGAPDRRSPSLRRGRRPLSEVAHDGRFGAAWLT
jgi:nitroreductase